MTIPANILEADAAGRIPAGVSLEFLAQSKDDPSLAGIWTLAALVYLLFLLRLYARTIVLPIYGLDDFLACCTMILYIAFTVLCTVLIRLGSGRHYDYIKFVMPPYTVGQTEILDYAAHLIYTTALLICRLSGLAFYKRICGSSPRFRMTIRIAAVFLVLAWIPQFLLILLHCNPVTGLWPYSWQTPVSTKYTCMQWGIVYSVNSAVSLTSDLILFAIPAAIIYSLQQRSTREKLRLSLILMPGVFVIAISIARLVLVIQGQWESDESWYYDPLLGVENAEIGSTLIALSVPALHPLLAKWGDRAHAAISTALSGNRSRHSSVVQTPGANFSGIGSGSRGEAYFEPKVDREKHVLDGGKNIVLLEQVTPPDSGGGSSHASSKESWTYLLKNG